MSETAFSINDLLRRKLQTSLIVASLTLSVASTVFLLLFGEKIGFGVSLAIEDKLTEGFSTIFSRFIVFTGALIFVVGAVIVSFMVFLMMSQRIRDIGLMKAAGCPNDLIFGFFMTELLIVTFIGCSLGAVLGIVADFAMTSIFGNFGFQIAQKPINFWSVLLVFVAFFAFAMIFGAKPVLDTTRIEPAKAISPTYYFGLGKESGLKIVSKSGLTVKIALRSLFRRKSAGIRIILCLSAVFLLVTVAVAGGIIANQTTKNWIERAVGRDIIVVAHKDMGNQYVSLLSEFYEGTADSQFNYTDGKYLIPESLLNLLNSNNEITNIDERLVLNAHVKEIPRYYIDPETGATIPVGLEREGESLIVGVKPQKALSEWFVDGRLLSGEHALEAVIGDSLAAKMFTMPLLQRIELFNLTLDIAGVCVDPIDNGNVTYVPLKTLQDATGILEPNLVMIRVSSNDRLATLEQIRANVIATNSEFEAIDLNEVLDKDLGFLDYLWSAIMVLPFFSLAAAALCLVGYVTLAITEQRQEFGVLRALGARPRTIIDIVSVQSFIVLLSSCAVGIELGVIITLLILIPEPSITGFTILEIFAWLLVALCATFVLSLYPAVRFARKPLPEVVA